MKKILNSPFWKSVFGIVYVITMILVFSFVENQKVKTLIGMIGFTLMLFPHYREKLSDLRKNKIYQILIVLIIGLFTTNFIVFRMKNDLLTIITTLTIIVGSLLLLNDNFQKRKPMWNNYKFKVFLNVSLITIYLICVYVILTDNFGKLKIPMLVFIVISMIYPIQRLLKLKKEQSN